MNYKRIESILLYVLVIISAGVYLYTVAPTLSFWDCGEFIASANNLAVPHPPGTPLYVVFGRVWLLLVGLLAAVLPISKEVAWHMNLLGVGLTVLTVVLVYRMMLKIFRMFRSARDELVIIIVAFATSLSIAFFFTVWRNAIETEVYAVSSFVFVLINYLALLWYESVRQGVPKHRYVLFIFYLIFLSSAIHLTPFLIFVPIYIFMFIVERRYIKDVFLLLLGVFQLLIFAVSFILPEVLFKPSLVILAIILLLGLVLPLYDPRRFTNWRVFWAGIFLVLVGLSIELYLPIRAQKLTELYQDKEVTARYLAGENIAPRINECNPGEDFSFSALFDFHSSYNSVLHRGQYGPQRIIPRQTQDGTGYGLVTGVFWQLALFVRYMSWQPLPESIPTVFRFIVYMVFYGCGIWGFVELYKRDRKVFILLAMIMFMLSFAMVGYLNLKFSPSDRDSEHQPREVRERDYFFHTGHVYFGIMMGFGFLGLLDVVRKETKGNRVAHAGTLSGIVLFSLIPLVTNIRVNNRFGDFIPRDYGYNMLVSCDDGAIVFTNGDNDTFPLWFAQEVLGIKRKVTVANLSLINTNWYIKQLKYWGVPIHFSDYIIDRLEPFVTPDRRVVYVKDILIRHIIATNAGIKLSNEDYFITQEEFAARHLKEYKGERPIYFASTVSRDNYVGFAPYLKLEGLVYRVTGDSADPLLNVDIKKTKNFFYKTYRYTGIFDPEKQEKLSHLLVDYEKRKQEGEFYNFATAKDENTLRLYSNYAAGLHSLGVVLKEYGDIRGTIDAWQFALLFEPQPRYFFNYNLGLLYAQMGVTDSAESYFSRIEVTDAHIAIQIGSVFRMMGKLDKSIEYFEKAKEFNPTMPQVYFGLYAAYIDKGDTASAIRTIQEWITINPRDTSAINMLKELQRQ
jgi:tetratricopeptide (TPR) repeat protein